LLGTCTPTFEQEPADAGDGGEGWNQPKRSHEGGRKERESERAKNRPNR
jgi:hypothetical protein